MSEESEIFEKIENEHRAGAHVTGPQAGCTLCAVLLADAAMAPDGSELSPDEAIDELARRRAGKMPDVPRRQAVPSAEEIASWGDDGERTLGDVALEDAQQAIDDLDSLAQQGIVVPNEKQALVHAQIGVVRALAGIEQQLVYLNAHLRGEGVRVFDANVHAADTPLTTAPEVAEDGARRSAAERIARAGLPAEALAEAIEEARVVGELTAERVAELRADPARRRAEPPDEPA